MRLRRIHLALLLASCSPVSAQTHKPPKPLPPSAFKLVSIKVTGTKRYSSEEIAAATGLQVGHTVTEDDFKLVSRHLGETGAFSDVAYAFQFSPEGTKLDLQLTDADHFVPVSFDNLVWFSEKELFNDVRLQVPLFHGELPVAGDLADQVSNALQALLIDHKIEGHVDYLRSAHQDGPIEGFVFTVTGPTIRVRNIDFTGAAPSELAVLQTMAAKMTGQEFLRSVFRIRADKDLIPIYLERGYLKAAFAEAQPKVVQDGPQETIVDVTFAVDPGHQYKTSDIRFSGNQVFGSDKLRQLVHQRLDEPANAIQLEDDLSTIRKLYGTRGYMAVSTKAVAETDDAQSSVRYMLEIQEGGIFQMGDLDIRGLDKRATGRLFTEWRLLAGDPYDSSYPQRFLKEAASDLLGEWDITVHESLNDTDKEKTVDVTLRFEPKPR